MAHSDKNLNKIAEFLSEQEKNHRDSHSKKVDINPHNEEALDQIHKFLENQSNYDEHKECIIFCDVSKKFL